MAPSVNVMSVGRARLVADDDDDDDDVDMMMIECVTMESGLCYEK